MNTYQVYLPGCSNPVWTYKTFTRLEKRLLQLAKETSLQSCTVNFPIRFGSETVQVKFSRSTKRYGWVVADPGEGIPTKLGMGNFTVRMTNHSKGI